MNLGELTLKQRLLIEVISCGMHRSNKSGVGTWGASVGLLIQIILTYLGISLTQMIVLAVATLTLGVLITEEAEKILLALYGPRKRYKGGPVKFDFNQDCFDEVVGQLVAGLFVMMTWSDFLSRFIGFILVFGLFRLFDIWKPWPINWIEKAFYPGSAFGIIFDDVAAGILAGILLWPTLFYLFTLGMWIWNLIQDGWDLIQPLVLLIIF